MIDGLSESTRALLDAARQGLAPDAAAMKRVHAKVAAGGLFAGLGAKLLALALVAGAGAAIVVAQRGSTADVPVVAVPETAAIEVTPAAAVTARVEAPPPAPPAAAPILVVVEHHADLAREVALIDAASHAEPRAALAVLQVYDAETAGHGQLAEDAAAIGIEARCKLHEDVDPKLVAFDARWPSSAQRARLTEACK